MVTIATFMQTAPSPWLSLSIPWSRGVDPSWEERDSLQGSSCTQSRRSSFCWHASTTPGTGWQSPLHECTFHISGERRGEGRRGSKQCSYGYSLIEDKHIYTHIHTHMHTSCDKCHAERGDACYSWTSRCVTSGVKCSIISSP